MQPSSHESRPFDPWLQSVTWLCLAPLALMGGCFSGYVMTWLIRLLASGLNPISWPDSSSHLVFSITAGSVMAILLWMLWHRSLHHADLWRFIGNILVMSCSVFIMLMVLYTMSVTDTFPLGWLAPALVSGVVLSLLHWFMLLSRTRQAIWWLPIMTVSWTLVWFVVAGFIWVLND